MTYHCCRSGASFSLCWYILSFILQIWSLCSTQSVVTHYHEVFVHYYNYPEPISIDKEKALYVTINESECRISTEISPYCSLCSAISTPHNSTSLLCPSLDHFPTINASSLGDAGSIFIGLTQDQISLHSRVVFDSYSDTVIGSVGNSTSVLHCSNGTGSGMDLINITRNVYLFDIEVLGCGGLPRVGNIDYHANQDHTTMNPMQVMGGIRLVNCLDVVMVKVVVTHSIGSAVIIAINNGAGYNVLDTSRCIVPGNSSSSSDWSLGQRQPVATVTIEDCYFASNNYSLLAEPLYGGGMFINMADTSLISSVDITINNSIFHDNRATYGGGIATLIANSQSINNKIHILIANTNFSENTAYIDGGGYYQLGGGMASIEPVFVHCHFSFNHALHYGGACAVLIITNTPSSNVNFNDTQFIGNRALDYAVLYATHVSTSIPTVHDTSTSLLLLLHDVVMEENYVYPEVYNTQHCILYLSNINGFFTGSVEFTSNRGSVICLDNADIHMRNDVEFSYNIGYNGGAMYIQGRSVVYLHGNVSVSFIRNAAVTGGAIFRNGLTEPAVSNDNGCIFNVENTQNGYSVRFIDNRASLSGYAIFHTLLDSSDTCYHSNPHIVFRPVNNSLNIESSVVNITFSDPVYFNERDGYVLYVSLGIHLSFTTRLSSYKSQFESAAMFYVTFLQGNELYSGDVLLLNGPASLSLSQGLTISNIYFTGDNFVSNKDGGNNFSLRFNLADNYAVSTIVKLKFVPCKLGFQYNDEERKCVCIQSSHILCNERLNLSCIERGFWHGADGATIPCYSGYCKNSFESCSLCDIEDGGYEYCRLQATEQEECRDNRGDLACVYCVDGFVYTYAALRCISRDSCNAAKDISLLILGCVVSLIAILVMLYVILKLDNEKNFGYLYVITYYYSVIGFVLPATQADSQLSIGDVIIQSIITLNPIFLGHFDLCVESLNHHPIALISISYLYPLVIVIIMAAAIASQSRLSNRLQFKDNTIVKGICVIVLFSFTSILETSFHIINPVTYFSETDNEHDFRVSSDPAMKYLQSPLHIVLWVIALLLVTIIILPSTFFLLLSPLLMKYRSFIKLKPFLDQFHACYQDKYRWMAGFYFLNRLLYFTVIIDPLMNEVNSYPYIRILSVMVAIIHCYTQPYSSRLLNISDAVILSVIAFLSLLHNVPEISFFGVSRESSRTVLTSLTYILLYIPSVYLLILLVVFTVKKSSRLQYLLNIIQSWLSSCVYIFKPRSNTIVMETSDSSDDDSVTLNFKTENNANYASNCREPLISLIGQLSPQLNDNDRDTRPASPTASSGSSLPEVIIHEPSSQPSFYELDGATGDIKSCDDRGDSFVVVYEKYKNKTKLPLTDNEMIDVNSK